VGTTPTNKCYDCHGVTAAYTSNLEYLVFDPPNIIGMIKSSRMRLVKPAGHVARVGEKKTAYKRLVGYPEGNTLLGRLRRK
jgi:hypothetical protein